MRHKEDCIKKGGSGKGCGRIAAIEKETQMRNESAYKDCFEDLFDIAHCEALLTITIDENRQFLIAQREEGQGGESGKGSK